MSFTNNNYLITYKHGISRPADVDADYFLTKNGWQIGRIKSLGELPVYLLTLSNGQVLECLETLVIQTENNIDKLVTKLGQTPILPFKNTLNWMSDAEDINEKETQMLGYLQGDGSYQTAGGLVANIGKDDKDVYNLFQQYNKYTISGFQLLIPKDDKLVVLFDKLQMSREEILKRNLPPVLFHQPARLIFPFLCGLFSANGCVIEESGRIQLKSINLEMLEQVQILLLALNIQSYITHVEPRDVEWDNGNYTSKASHDLNIIKSEWGEFEKNINFIQKYKKDLLEKLVKEKSESGYHRPITIDSIKKVGNKNVYDIKFLNKEDSYVWVNGLSIKILGI